jgi:hypothetical protein
MAILAVVFGNPQFVVTVREWILTQSERQFPGPWSLSRMVFVGLTSMLIAYGITAIHELGHLIVGVCVGFRCRSMFVGPLQFNAPFRIALNPDRRAWWHGGVSLYPEKADRLCARAIPMVFAGPAANLLTGCSWLLMPITKDFFSWLFIGGSIAAGVVELLLPLYGPTFVFDGKRIWMLLRDRARGERWLALMNLIADTRAGVLPESLSAEFRAKATAVCDESAETVIAHAIAYTSAFHEHRDSDAGGMLETSLRYSSCVAPALREALMSEAAVFQARRRKNAALAEKWLADMPAKPQFPWFRSRVEAAILEANDNVDGALRKLDEGEKSILALPDPAQREMLLRLIRKWRAELDRR